jgi:hypothetical protein
MEKLDLRSLTITCAADQGVWRERNEPGKTVAGRD